MLQGVIQSVEEYGYLVNVGIKGVTAFLNKSEVSQKKCDIVRVVVKTVNDGNLILGKYQVFCPCYKCKWYNHLRELGTSGATAPRIRLYNLV